MSKKIRQAAISFTAQGHVVQTIEIISDHTLDQIIKMLNKGTAVTTVQEGTDKHPSYIELTATGEKIAKITDVDNQLEYNDFDIDEDEEEIDAKPQKRW